MNYFVCLSFILALAWNKSLAQECASGTDCSLDSCVCPNGQTCFRKNEFWAGCLDSCTVGMTDDFDDLPWACTVVTNDGDGGGEGEEPDPESFSCDSLQDNVAAVDRSNFARDHGKLKLDGVQLVDANGEKVTLRGMSSHGLHFFPACYDDDTLEDSIKFLVENWGINVFRAAMYIDEGGYATNQDLNKERVKKVVQVTEELGIYCIIDWHILNPGDPNTHLDDRGASTGLAIDFWVEMAELYKDKSHIMYEIANEPNQFNGEAAHGGGDVTWEIILEYHNSVISAIRAIDPDTIIIAGTNTFSQDIHLAAATPVDAPFNVMYTFHFYSGTHESLLARVQQFKTQIPIFVTEWGTSLASGDGGPFLEITQRFLDEFNGVDDDDVTISWAQWSYADKDEISAALEPGACTSKSFDQTSCSGTFIKNFLKTNAALDISRESGEDVGDDDDDDDDDNNGNSDSNSDESSSSDNSGVPNIEFFLYGAVTIAFVAGLVGLYVFRKRRQQSTRVQNQDHKLANLENL